MLFYSPDFDRDIIINRKRKVRRLTLRVCTISGKISISAPLYLPNSEIKKFFIQNHNWISKQLKKCVVPVIVKKGIFLPIGGNFHQIIANKKITKIKINKSNEIFVPTNYSNVGCEVKKYLVEHCKLIMIPIILKNLDLINKKTSKINFKDTKSRWGSCSSNGSIMLNWRLIMAPPSIYKYVIIHELSHLIHMNHGSQFWELVRKLHPTYLEDKKWLRTNGKEIRKYVF